MGKILLKAPLAALGISIALTGCIKFGTQQSVGEFDATKSFVDIYNGYQLLGIEPTVASEHKPSGTVHYSGGILVEKERHTFLQSPVPLEPLPVDYEYIVAKMDVDVAFDDNTSNFAVTNFQRAKAPVTTFGINISGQNTHQSVVTINDVVMGEKLDGTISGSGVVIANSGNPVYVNAKLQGTLTSGSGDALETHSASIGTNLVLRGTSGNEFLLGSASLALGSADVRVKNEPAGLENALPANEFYYGAGYAVQAD